MSGANTRNVLARFGDNNWEKGKDFGKTFYVKKPVREMDRSLRQNFAKVAKFSENKSGQVVEKTFRPHFVFVWFHESNEI